MGVVRDVISCTSLLAFSVYAPAGTAALGSLAGNIAGNLGFKIHEAIGRGGLAKMTRGWRGIEENHVVVQGLRAAYLEALQDVLKTYREIARTAPDRTEHEAFADTVAAFAKSEWTEAERLGFVREGSLTPTEFAIRRRILTGLPNTFGAALSARRSSAADPAPPEAFVPLRDALVRGALQEIESRTLPEGRHAPALFRAVFEGTNVPDSWFDLFIRAAATRLKDHQPFAAIWNAEQTEHIRAVVEDMRRRLARVQTMLEIPLNVGTATDAQLARIVEKRPTDLLLARFRVVPFLDFTGALRNALDWAHDPRIKGAAGRLYVAPGGFGKTRMAIELALELSGEGWDCTFLSPRTASGMTAGALQDLMSADADGTDGLLVVIDYAESQIPLLKQVMHAASGCDGRPIRLVALARSAEGWWKGTQDALVFDPAPYELIEQALTTDQRTELLQVATEAYRQALPPNPPGAPADVAALMNIMGRVYDRPLTVAMAAYLSARGAAPAPGESVLARIFQEEARHWRRVLGVERDNDPDLVSLHRAAAQITLVQRATLPAGRALMRADPRNGPDSRREQERCLAALQTIYGDTDGIAAVLRPIEPDLLGEHVAMAALKHDTDHLLEATLGVALSDPAAFPEGVASMLTVLTRATREEHDRVTRETAVTAIGRLSDCAATLPPDDARRLSWALPRYATPLLALSATVARRVADACTGPAEEAQALDWLSIRLSETGDRAGALEPARRALAIRETLARENPAAYLPDLARGLNNLGIRLSETGDRAGALEPARRALAIYETLARENPAAYLPDLAHSLHNLGNRLSETGDRAGALEPVRRALAIYETLARENPAAYLPDLARGLNNLGIRLNETGDRAGALEPARRALAIRETLARENPAAYLPDLAGSLHNLGNRLSETGDRAGALEPVRRALAIYETLARDNPAAYLPGLARSLHNFDICLSQTGDRAGALEPALRAVAIRETLARENPAAYLPDLASSLHNLGIRLSQTGDRAGALEPARRAVAIHETLARENPAAYLPDLARSLHNLGNRLSETGDRAGALEPARRALAIYETLARENPAAYLPDLARGLHNFGICLSQTGDRAGALECALRAVAIQETLARENPAAYLPDLAGSLHNLGNLLSDTGDRAGALEPARRALAIRETLARENPAAYLPDLADSLHNLGYCLSEMGDRAAALEPARRAVANYETLARENPAAYLPDLADSLENLLEFLQSLDAPEAAEVAERLRQVRAAIARLGAG